MSSIVNLKALGLNTQPNLLELPPGSLTEASNVIIRRDDVVESRRGFKVYGNDIGSSSDRASQLAIYKGRILRHYNSVLEFDTGSSNTSGVNLFSAFAGSFSQVDAGLRIKSIESNGNFYFTTSDGIKKISAASTSEFSTAADYITQAGGIKALDTTAILNYLYSSQTDFFTQNSVVAYRVVWGIRDANTNLILGAPSQRVQLYNPLTNTLIQDFNAVLRALDYINETGCLIDDGDYVSTLKLADTASANDLYTNLVALAVKIDNDIIIANDSGSDGINSILNISGVTAPTTTSARIAVSAGTPSDYISVGSKIRLTGFGTGSVSGVNINGTYTVSNVQAGYFDIPSSGLNVLDTFAHTSGVVDYNEFSSIATPTTPSIPTTAAELEGLQTYLDAIIQELQGLPIAILPSSLSSEFIIVLDITTTATVTLKFRIPESITDDYFYQVYRTSVSEATDTTVLSDLDAGDEMKLVFEEFPTSTELSNGEVVVVDDTPDSFRGANLYTNPSSGEGILQANDNIPAAKDINKFKNYTFYANTRTRHFKLLSLLGVAGMIDEFNASRTPKLTITTEDATNTYSFIIGEKEETKFTCVADVANSLNGTYFLINNAEDAIEYYVWFKTSGGAVSDPAPAGKTGIRVNIITGSTASAIAIKVRDVINSYSADFTATSSSADVTIETVDVGYTTDGSAGTSGFTVAVLTQGTGENATNKEVLISSNASPAIAVDETARSLVRIINKNSDEDNYAYYLSGVNDVPGKMQIEARSLDTNIIYFLTNNAVVGAEYSPDLSPTGTISAFSVANPTVVTSSTHGMINGDKVVICNSTSTPSTDGVYPITYVSSTSFTIPVNVTVTGTAVFIRAVDAEISENEMKSNRVYFSKLQQPEAVPIVNYMEIGNGDDEILRIFPLRDSLFVFKKNGLYRISGEVSPFSVSLFDSSCNLLASDSLSIVNNTLYGWTNAGISSITEAGVSVISRPIDVDILKLATSQYTNFRTVTWGIGYEADNTYTVYTVVNTNDESAKIGYRYCTLTSSWTTIDKEATCGIINSSDDKMYLGAGDVNSIEQERKTYSRYDYSDREYSRTLPSGYYFGDSIRLTSIDDLNVGDVITQDQTITVYEFNGLLNKLDMDIGVSDSDYFSSLEAIAGDDLKEDLLSLASKLDADSGVNTTDYNSTITQKTGTITSITAANPTVITTTSAHNLFSGRILTISGSNSTPSIDGAYEITVTGASTFTIDVSITVAGTSATWTTLDSDFRDLKACYNKTIAKLNADTTVAFGNYVPNTVNTIQECVVLDVDANTKVVTLDQSLDLIVGALTSYEAINCTLTYAPQTFGDTLSLKQVREATMMFINRAFTNATLSFSSDLIPEFFDTDFNGDGGEIFGHQSFGSKFFGGGSNSAPFRTYIPRDIQRCRYIVCRFTHNIAREQFGIVGVSLTGEIISSRAYR